MSIAEPIMLEKWYTGSREISVVVAEGVNATLVNRVYGKKAQSYTLRTNVFTTGSDPLYAGSWQVEIDSLTIEGYTLNVRVYRGSEEYTEYGSSEFEVDGNVSKIEINIRTMEVELNGSVATLVNTNTNERITLTEGMYSIEEGTWRVEITDSTKVLEVIVHNNTGNTSNYEDREFTVDMSVSKVEIRVA